MAYPSSFLDIQNDVIDKLRLNAADDLANVKDWINQAYAEVASETRCFQTDGVATMTAAVGSYLLPASVLHIELLTITPTGADTWFPMKECQLPEILNMRGLGPGAIGPPTRYAVVGLNQLEVWPAARSGDVMNFWNSYLPTALSGDGDVPAIPEPHASNLLGYGACVQGAEFKRDVLTLSNYQGQYNQCLQAFQRYLNRKGGAYPQAFPTWTGGPRFPFSDPSTDLPWYAVV